MIKSKCKKIELKAESSKGQLKQIGLCLALFIFAFLLLYPFFLQAKPSWQSNKLRERQKWEKVQEEIDQIPLYKEKLEGNYQIIGFVRGDDLWTNKHHAIYNKMKREAFEMGADAIMEVKCKRIAKWFAQHCEGFAIKYLSLPEETAPQEDQ